MTSLMDYLLSFAYYYPLFMAYVWMCGGIYYRLHWETEGGERYDAPEPLDIYPPVSILVPFFNEEKNVVETVKHLALQTYPDFEIVAINDGSADGTAGLLDDLAEQYDSLRVIHLESNQGKAMALRMGTLLSSNEYLVCVDGDSVLDHHATHWLIRHFINSPRVGAVTGNPRIRNRSTILGKIQVGEFSSIVGLIKRAQRIYGRVFTVSGVVVAFRKAALQRVGYWNVDMVTEDIDVSWRLQLDHWDIRYEPNALCWILMPETLIGLWRQRLRWAQGGAEVAGRYFKSLKPWTSRRMWVVMIEYVLSVIWSYVALFIIVLWLVGKFITLPPEFSVPTIVPGWNGVVLGITCLIQFMVSLVIDSRYEKNLFKYYFWIVWYPLAYWMINVITVSVGVPKAILKTKGTRAIWSSPDRGVHQR